MPKWLKILLTVVAVAAGIVLLAVVIAWIAGYNTPMDLVQYLGRYLAYIWTEQITA